MDVGKGSPSAVLVGAAWEQRGNPSHATEVLPRDPAAPLVAVCPQESYHRVHPELVAALLTVASHADNLSVRGQAACKKTCTHTHTNAHARGME